MVGFVDEHGGRLQDAKPGDELRRIAGDDQHGDGRMLLLGVQGYMLAVHTMTVLIPARVEADLVLAADPLTSSPGRRRSADMRAGIRRFDVAYSERPLNHVQQLRHLERLVQEGDVT